MVSKIPDLWSNDISVDVLTPLTILKAQIQGLERRTQGLLEVDVSTQLDEKSVTHWFDLVAPALDRFRERILIAFHARDRVYPVTVEAACFLDKYGLRKTAMSQEEFFDLVREVLQSGEVRSSIQSLLARSNEARTHTSPTDATSIAETVPPSTAEN